MDICHVKARVCHILAGVQGYKQTNWARPEIFESFEHLLRENFTYVFLKCHGFIVIN